MKKYVVNTSLFFFISSRYQSWWYFIVSFLYSIYGSVFAPLHFKRFLTFLAVSATHRKCFCSRFTGYFEVYRLVRKEEELTDQCCGHLRSVNDARLKLSVCNPNERTIMLPADSKPLKCHHLSLPLSQVNC